MALMLFIFWQRAMADKKRKEKSNRQKKKLILIEELYNF